MGRGSTDLPKFQRRPRGARDVASDLRSSASHHRVVCSASCYPFPVWVDIGMLITWCRDATNWFLRAKIYTLALEGREGVKWYQSVRRLLDVRMSVSWFDQSVKNNLIETWKFHVKNPSLNIDTFFDEKRKVAKNLHKHNAFCVAERLFNQGGCQKIYHGWYYKRGQINPITLNFISKSCWILP